VLRSDEPGVQTRRCLHVTVMYLYRIGLKRLTDGDKYFTFRDIR
jgi:hypothetical protein